MSVGASKPRHRWSGDAYDCPFCGGQGLNRAGRGPGPPGGQKHARQYQGLRDLGHNGHGISLAPRHSASRAQGHGTLHVQREYVSIENAKDYDRACKRITIECANRHWPWSPQRRPRGAGPSAFPPLSLVQFSGRGAESVPINSKPSTSPGVSVSTTSWELRFLGPSW